METNVRELKAHLSEFLHRAALGEEVLVTLRGRPLVRLVPLTSAATPETLADASIASLHTLPWISPGNGSKPQGSANPVRIGPDEKNLAEIVSDLRG